MTVTTADGTEYKFDGLMEQWHDHLARALTATAHPPREESRNDRHGRNLDGKRDPIRSQSARFRVSGTGRGRGIVFSTRTSWRP